MFLQVSVILLTGGTCVVVGGWHVWLWEGAHSCWGCVVVGEGGMCSC